MLGYSIHVGSGVYACIQQSQAIMEIGGGNTVVIVTLTTVQRQGYRAAHAH